MKQLFNDASQVESAVAWISIIILVLSAPFTRALQRMYERSYGAPGGGWKKGWRGLAGLAVWLLVSAPLREGCPTCGPGHRRSCLGAVIGAIASERMDDRLERIAR